MSASAQELHDDYLAEISKSGRIPSLLDRAKAWKHAREAAAVPVAANDEVAVLLGDLPFDLPHVAVPAVTDLNGKPIEPAPKAAPTSRLKRDLVTRPGSSRRRKSQLRDRENRARRVAYRRSQITSATTPLAVPSAEHPTPTPANANTPPAPSQTPSDATHTKRKTGRPRKARARMAASWEEAGELTRLDYVNQAGAAHGQPFAWTLNLAPAVERAANDNARGPLDYIARAVRRHLDREPALTGAALPSWLVIETTAPGRLHVHGAVFVANPELLPAIARALSKAGGKWDAKAGEGYQTDIAPQRHPDAWAAYPLKRQGRTRRHLREAAGLAPDAPVPLTTWSRELVAEAKHLLAVERRAMGRA